MVKEIILSRNRGIALVDEEDFNELNQYKWRLHKHKDGHCYAITHVRSETTKSGYTNIGMHRVILKPKSNKQIDHVNNNGLDNRKINLRICNSSQNGGNRRKNKGKTTSEFKGVYWHKRRDKWCAYIRGKHIGSFDSEYSAALAYNKKAKKIFGKFAYLNDVSQMVLPVVI